MGELYADTKFAPWEVPGDAVLITVWRQGTPPRWEVLAMGTGYATLGDVATDLAKMFPGEEGSSVMVTKVGGTSSRVKIFKRNISVSVTESDPVPPPPPPA